MGFQDRRLPLCLSGDDHVSRNILRDALDCTVVRASEQLGESGSCKHQGGGIHPNMHYHWTVRGVCWTHLCHSEWLTSRDVRLQYNDTRLLPGVLH